MPEEYLRSLCSSLCFLWLSSLNQLSCRTLLRALFLDREIVRSVPLLHFARYMRL